MNKVTLSDAQALSMIENWQREIDNSDKLVRIIDFSLNPQSQVGRFMLRVEIYIAGESEHSLDGKTKCFYGSISECVSQTIEHMDEIKESLRKRL